MTTRGKCPDRIYRVGVKAVIRDEDGRVLCVHDTGEADMWSLPGGGLDHGDDIRSGMARELEEEIAYSGDFTMQYVDTFAYFSEAVDIHVLYMIFDVELLDSYEPTAGVDALEVAYIEEGDLRKYTDRQAEIIQKYGFSKDIDVPIYK